MRQRRLLLLILPSLCGILVLNEASKAQNPNKLQSFFVVTEFFSDSLADSYDEILEVTANGKDVRVRVIRISSATRYCGGQLVRAAERILPDTTINKVNGNVDLCSYTEHEVKDALKAASPKAISDTWDSATLSIVAKCAAQETVLDFPYPAQVDMKALGRDNPRIRTLWDLNYRVRRHAFGKNFSFRSLSGDREKELEDLGTKLLPELVSGKFDTGFGDYTCANEKCDTNYLAWRLREYTGPPINRDPASVELVNSASLHLEKYDPPQYSPIAKTAHIFGEVRLRIVPDKQTGLVKDVQLESGNPLLGSLAINAAKNWRFSPETLSEPSTEAVLKFSLCPDK